MPSDKQASKQVHTHVHTDDPDVVVPSEPTSGDPVGVEHADELPRQATQSPNATDAPDTDNSAGALR